MIEAHLHTLLGHHMTQAFDFFFLITVFRVLSLRATLSFSGTSCSHSQNMCCGNNLLQDKKQVIQFQHSQQFTRDGDADQKLL